jgi:hypothetical protein
MTKILRCAIIEDEPLAQELFEKYVRRVASVEAFDQLPFSTLPILNATETTRLR